MRVLRELLTATGGNVEELANWAAAVRDTDDDSAAVSAYLVRVKYRAITERARKAAAEARAQEDAHALRNIRREPKRPGPKGDRFTKIDTLVVLVAERLLQLHPPQLLPPATSVEALVSEAVRRVNEVLTAFPGIGPDALICKAVSQPLQPGARPAATSWSLDLGQSKEAAVARIFARLRRQRVKGWRGTIPADLGWSHLADRIQPRRPGVRKFGRPHSKSDPN
jgi:hypothetical protein